LEIDNEDEIESAIHQHDRDDQEEDRDEDRDEDESIIDRLDNNSVAIVSDLSVISTEDASNTPLGCTNLPMVQVSQSTPLKNKNIFSSPIKQERMSIDKNNNKNDLSLTSSATSDNQDISCDIDGGVVVSSSSSSSPTTLRIGNNKMIQNDDYFHCLNRRCHHHRQIEDDNVDVDQNDSDNDDDQLQHYDDEDDDVDNKNKNSIKDDQEYLLVAARGLKSSNSFEMITTAANLNAAFIKKNEKKITCKINNNNNKDGNKSLISTSLPCSGSASLSTSTTSSSSASSSSGVSSNNSSSAGLVTPSPPITQPTTSSK
jgi:hypothetical protein